MKQSKFEDEKQDYRIVTYFRIAVADRAKTPLVRNFIEKSQKLNKFSQNFTFVAFLL